MARKKSADRPLRVSIERDQLVIRLGVNTLAHAAEYCPVFYDDEHNADPPFIKVTDRAAFAVDVLRALQHEEEDGSGPLSKLLDDAIELAYDDGSEAVEYEEVK